MNAMSLWSRVVAGSLILVSCGWGQIRSGAGNIGTGAVQGARDLAKGTAKGAVNLATLHPIDAGVSIGKGAGAAGKDVAVGTVKGTGKIGKGVGRAIKKVL